MHENKKILIDIGQISVDSIHLPQLPQHRVTVDVLRLDLLHPVVSGNKWFKLKQWLTIAQQEGYKRIITFGGAWSNHIVAAAWAARAANIPVTGIIRGEKPANPSITLQDAASYGMELIFVSRNEYGNRNDPAYIDNLRAQHPDALIIPEGGAGEPGEKGSGEILQTADTSGYTHILCAIGTGTTFKGLKAAALPHQQVIGISVLEPPYHFGGYARHTPALIGFLNQWYRDTGIPADIVYTGKLFFAALDMLQRRLFPEGARLLIIHSGGLQGNRSLKAGLLDF